MKRTAFIFLYVIVQHGMRAQDSIKVVSKKFSLDINFSRSPIRNPRLFIYGNFSDPETNLSGFNSLETNFQRRLFGNKLSHDKNGRDFYAGLNYAACFLNFNAITNNYSEPGHFGALHTFTDSQIKKMIWYNTFGIHINYRRFFEKDFFISQTLGLSVTLFDKSQISHTYSETVSYSYPDTSPAYVTPQNPQGWYWVNSSSSSNRTDTYSFNSGLNYFYKIGAGMKFKKFEIYFGGDIMYFGSHITFYSPQYFSTRDPITQQSIIIRYNAGVSYEF